MLRAILFAVLFIIIGGVAFALVAPLIFRGDLQKVGATAFPFIILICGGTGFALGRRRGR